MSRERLYRMTEIQRNMLVVALMDEYRKQKARGVPYPPIGRLAVRAEDAPRHKNRLPWDKESVPFPVSWTVKMKKKQKETQDILSYHTQAAGCSDKARAKASGGRQPIEECGRTGL